jgi:hypothetical protein
MAVILWTLLLKSIAVLWSPFRPSALLLLTFPVTPRIVLLSRPLDLLAKVSFLPLLLLLKSVAEDSPVVFYPRQKRCNVS